MASMRRLVSVNNEKRPVKHAYTMTPAYPVLMIPIFMRANAFANGQLCETPQQVYAWIAVLLDSWQILTATNAKRWVINTRQLVSTSLSQDHGRPPAVTTLCPPVSAILQGQFKTVEFILTGPKHWQLRDFTSIVNLRLEFGHIPSKETPVWCSTRIPFGKVGTSGIEILKTSFSSIYSLHCDRILCISPIVIITNWRVTFRMTSIKLNPCHCPWANGTTSEYPNGQI